LTLIRGIFMIAFQMLLPPRKFQGLMLTGLRLGPGGEVATGAGGGR